MPVHVHLEPSGAYRQRICVVKFHLRRKGDDDFDKHLQLRPKRTFLHTIEFPIVGPNCLPYPRKSLKLKQGGCHTRLGRSSYKGREERGKPSIPHAWFLFSTLEALFAKYSRLSPILHFPFQPIMLARSITCVQPQITSRRFRVHLSPNTTGSWLIVHFCSHTDRPLRADLQHDVAPNRQP